MLDLFDACEDSRVWLLVRQKQQLNFGFGKQPEFPVSVLLW